MRSRWMTPVTLALLALVTATCAHQTRTPSHSPCPSYELTHVAGADGMILPAGALWLPADSQGAKQLYWTPALPDLVAAETSLPDYLNRVAPTLPPKYQIYVPQYPSFYHEARYD